MYFNYFLPGRNQVTLDELLGMGLRHAFEPETAATVATPFTPRGVVSGPGGQQGLMVSRGDDWVGYYPDRQTWRQELGQPYWVGMWHAADQRPRPETLERDNVIPGATLRLDDGYAWTIPRARHYEEFDGQIVTRRVLPARLTRDEAGQWVPGEVKERYRRLWTLTTEYLEAIIAAAEDETGRVIVRFSQVDDLVMEAMTCNYRVGPIELDLLGIYDDHMRDRVLRILTDLDGWAALCKKKLNRPGTGDSPSGPADSPPDADTESTDPRSRT